MQQRYFTQFGLFLERSTWRWIVLGFVYLLFIVGFVAFRHRVDYVVNLFYGVPLILTTYYLGFWAGVVLLVLEAVIHMMILSFLGESYSFIYQNHRIQIAFVSLLVTGYFVSLFRNVKNELKKSEERYKSVSEEMLKLNETRDRFFSIIAHDLRSPIGSLTTNIDLLVNYNQDLTADEKNRLLKSLQTTTTRVFNLLENLLKWALVQRGDMLFHFEVVNVRKVCHEAAKLLMPLALEKQISIVNNVNADDEVWTDVNVMGAVVRNLLSNAIKFSYDKSRVELSSERLEDWLALNVRDYGVGISAEKQNIIFTSEEQVGILGTHGEKGTGLGLMLCYDLIEKCKGRITVESKPNEGSTFTILLPLS
jgi:signal transduction histidine kinase